MINIIRPKLISRSILIMALTWVTLTWCASGVQAQTDALPPSSSSRPVADDDAAGIDAVTGPTFREYKGVRIGMSADEVRQKLGTPELKDKTEDLFLISDVERVQVVYDKDGKVSALSITYSNKNEAAPSALSVLGEAVAAGADGRVYKLVRYPTVGYWVAYSRTAGDAPVVSVTMKKMRVTPR
jgi:hypothetical protein